MHDLHVPIYPHVYLSVMLVSFFLQSVQQTGNITTVSATTRRETRLSVQTSTRQELHVKPKEHKVI